MTTNEALIDVWEKKLVAAQKELRELGGMPAPTYGSSLTTKHVGRAKVEVDNALYYIREGRKP